MKKFKRFFAIISLLLVVALFAGCTQNSLLNDFSEEEKTQIEQALKGTNGIDGKDGKDGDQIDLFEVYTKLVELNQFSGTFADFVKEYINTEGSVYASSKALSSVVSIYSGFVRTITYQASLFNEHEYEEKYHSAGSGVIYRLNKETGDAYIITNYHVVFDTQASSKISTDISLFLYGNEGLTFEDEKEAVTDIYGNEYSYRSIVGDNKISAKYIGGSLKYDLAVLKVTGSEVLKNSTAEEAYFANSDEITVGESAIAVGNPSGSGISSTKGVISVDSEYLQMYGADDQTLCNHRVIRTDAPVNPGNSGGGLFNINGELIGVVNAKITSSKIENIGYAIPSNVASYIAENIIRTCDGETFITFKRAQIGISLMAKTSKAVYNPATLKTSIVEEVQIAKVENNSPVKALVEAGDIVKSAKITRDGNEYISKDIFRTFHLVDLSHLLMEGDTFTLTLTDSNGNPKADVSVVITREMFVEYA